MLSPISSPPTPRSSLPTTHNLFITTPNAIHLHPIGHGRAREPRLLFECDTNGGIVNAKAAKDNSGFFAVADGWVVVLVDRGRDGEEGTRRRYRLEGGDGAPRLLLFSPPSHILYFTTTLSPSVQAYSIPTAILLPPIQAHPSPPTILAISPNGNVLLSASANPPMLVLQDLHRGYARGTPLQFWPRHARAPVSCAAFRSRERDESEWGNCIFALGFTDGMIAVYRYYSQMLYTGNYPCSHHGMFHSRKPKRLGCVRKAHKAAMGGVCAVEFVPGERVRVVSVGHDGRCRIVDFGPGGGREGGKGSGGGSGTVLRTWYVEGVVSCLAITPTTPIHYRSRNGGNVILSEHGLGEDKEQDYGSGEVLIAVGTQTGKVLVFNILGLQVHEISVLNPIVALEWVGDMSVPSVLPNRRFGSPISYSELEMTAESSRSVLDMLIDEYTQVETEVEDFEEQEGEGQEQEENGTVRRTRSPTKSPGVSVSSPITFSPSRDLFSSSAERPTIPRARRPSDISYGSPEPRGRASIHGRVKRYPRPRIVTETFRDPKDDEGMGVGEASNALQLSSPVPMSSPVVQSPVSQCSADVESPITHKRKEVEVEEPRGYSRLSSLLNEYGNGDGKANLRRSSGRWGFEGHVSDTDHEEHEEYGEKQDTQMDMDMGREIWTTPPTGHKSRVLDMRSPTDKVSSGRNIDVRHSNFRTTTNSTKRSKKIIETHLFHGEEFT